MKSIKKILAMLSITTLAFSFTACGGGTSTPNAGATAENTSAAGDSLKVHIDVEVASMDPQVAVDGTSFEVLAAVTEGLYSLDADGSAIPAMADKVEKSEDGLTYTVTLKDAKWSNSTPVTANDFVFAWRRLVDPKTASEYAFMGGIAGLKNADDISAGKVSPDQLGVTAKDDKTLVIELDTPVPFFESLMAFPSFFPVNEEFYNKCGDKFATTVDTILCNGAFKVTSYEPAATTINLEKNPDYWDADKVQLSGIQYQVIKDSQQAMLAYQNGDLDVATLSGEQVEQFQADPEFQSIMAGYLWYISPNLKTPGLENENLRKALALSYDKDAIVNNILKDGSIKADFAVPTLLATGPDGKDFRDGTDTYLSTDKAKALEYYDKAKEELGKDSFSYTMIVEDTESAQNVAQFIQAEIQKTLPGVTINIETMPKKNRVERMQEGTFELGLTRWGPDYADPMTYLDMWTTDSPNNYGFWSNAEFDQIIQSAKKGELALDVNARWDALKKAEKMVMDEAVIFPVYQKGNAVMIKKNVSGIEFHSVAINRVYKNATKN
ncbi:peptide ABC transporter substrate-binding protein [Clostridium neonatale]|uniref:Peptide ABC transporter substrate-binding protein n=1 Tax=Clostridium neonatale TaxID=137838 RepID=A0A2A7ML74_9CLOT|nr:peptide ABC transporter substrate-binding protein [Clostridium neonatale]PEG28415.1 peptide ABC transporter substrate-binding protein [Clostridium neonatale]PEG32562.1 peptide ABC transporter substrate-binding protein [Clostridium neonatale]CAH0438819.1 ABC transporter, substrate-binding protein [Clostridium neonatale]